MRVLPALFLLFILPTPARTQVTLVREAPNDSFDLSCPRCSMSVSDIAITRGQHAIPMNLRKPVAVNLLMWRYYDNILKKDVLMANEPFWTTGVQLLEDMPDDEMLSLHLNLIWTDSTEQTHRIFLVMAGLTKKHLAKLPLECTYDPDTYLPLRFAAVAQISDGTEEWETYDCFEGSCTLNTFNRKTWSVSGTFDFIANRVGMEKKGIFENGTFQR